MEGNVEILQTNDFYRQKKCDCNRTLKISRYDYNQTFTNESNFSIK